MKLLEIKTNCDFPKFYCPITGTMILGEGSQGWSPATVGVVSTAACETEIQTENPELLKEWEATVGEFDAEKFLEAYEAPETWVTFVVIGGHGTDYIIIDTEQKEA